MPNEIYFILRETILAFALILPLNVLILSRTGLWSIGHIGFFGIGMLGTGLGISVLHVHPLVAGIFSLAAGAAAAAVIGACSLRLKDVYFLILSIGFAYLIHALNLSISSINGFSGLPRPLISGPAEVPGLYLLFLLLLPMIGLIIWLNRTFRRSSIDAWFAIARSNPDAAQAAGIPANWLRWLVFFIGSMAACWTGMAFCFASGGTSPSRCSLETGILLFANMIIGGEGSLRGALIGSLLFVLLPRAMELVLVNGFHLSFSASQISQLVFGAALILILRFRKERAYG
jgi:branched-chain amino acid transport system permease protein